MILIFLLLLLVVSSDGSSSSGQRRRRTTNTTIAAHEGLVLTVLFYCHPRVFLSELPILLELGEGQLDGGRFYYCCWWAWRRWWRTLFLELVGQAGEKTQELIGRLAGILWREVGRNQLVSYIIRYMESVSIMHHTIYIHHTIVLTVNAP